MLIANAVRWTVAAVSLRYFMKLAGNLVLAQLLAPTAFGQMAIVFALITSIEAITDVGTKPALIRSDRNDALWLDTAWTLGLIRGALIAVVILCAAVPAARFFKNDELAPLIAAMSLMSMATAARSINAIIAVRELEARRLAIFEFVEIILCYAIMVGWALVSPTAWALVAGTLVSVGLHSLFSYWIYARRQHRFRIDRAVAVELAVFGKWVMIASMMGLLIFQWDRVFIGRSLGLAEVGVYSIAITWAGSLQQLVGLLLSRLYMPILAKLRRLGQAGRTASNSLRRHILLTLLVPFAWTAANSHEIIDLLYSPSFRNAGPVLGLLVVAAWFAILEYLYNDQLMLAGQPQRRFQAQLISVAMMIIGVFTISESPSIMSVAAIVLLGTAIRAVVLLLAQRRDPNLEWHGDALITSIFLSLLMGLIWCLGRLADHFDPIIGSAISFAVLAPVGGWFVWRALRQTTALGLLIGDEALMVSPEMAQEADPTPL